MESTPQRAEELLFIASHELKSPLTAMLTQIQLLLRSARNGDAVPPEVLVRLLESSEYQGHRMTVLLNRILDVSRIRSGTLVLERSRLDLTEVARDVLNRFEPELVTAKCRVSFEATQPVLGMWDRGRIEQILLNLLTNAVKYGAAAPIGVSVTGDGRNARVVVRDRGCGIAPEHQSRIFDRFERAEAPMRSSGIGLGLYIVRQLVEAHGGQVSVESAPGAGSTFSVELPCAMA